MKNLLAGLLVLAGLLAGGAVAQTAPGTLAKIKAAKAINVAFSGDSLPFSFVDRTMNRQATRSTFASGSSRRSDVRWVSRTSRSTGSSVRSRRGCR